MDDAVNLVAVFERLQEQVRRSLETTHLTWDDVACVRCFHTLATAPNVIQQSFACAWNVEIDPVCIPVLHLCGSVLVCTVIGGTHHVDVESDW